MTISTSRAASKHLAIALRRKGYSYSEIRNFVSVPKSTLGLWLKKIKLPPLERERIRQKRIFGSRLGGDKKKSFTRVQIENIQKTSEDHIGSISKRELWLLGIMLYWRNRNNQDLHKGVRFMSSDFSLIRLFMRWLIEIGHLMKKEIIFDLFLHEHQRERKEGIIYEWMKITKFPRRAFSHVYFQKKYQPRKGVQKRVRTSSEFGMLRVRVSASSMLARQISGWISGINKAL